MDILVELGTGTPSVTLVDPQDFSSFRVLARGGGDRARLTQALEPYGRLTDDGGALIAPDGLQQLAGEHAQDVEWQRRLEAMLEYARARGWIDAETGAIRAHCDWA